MFTHFINSKKKIIIISIFSAILLGIISFVFYINTDLSEVDESELENKEAILEEPSEEYEIEENDISPNIQIQPSTSDIPTSSQNKISQNSDSKISFLEQTTQTIDKLKEGFNTAKQTINQILPLRKNEESKNKLENSLSRNNLNYDNKATTTRRTAINLNSVNSPRKNNGRRSSISKDDYSVNY
ncbi:MAG: putative secreted protein [Candidatus Phytoplasma cynodontis]|uniref:hypothetical protein n=1 Tax='Cynodon dactylon' phytoplasma TaxID=295320 RepID=UPI001265B075|nr:hypothetical protein ['Cynodon dactylon' phytoplasma]KAB8122069.1 hypothetical protein F1741_00820 ['Cynodon dactylon' phytoplasma]WIA07515.1 MAG: putative secreted protein [Candidatus Phytoplasma cynodontis]